MSCGKALSGLRPSPAVRLVPRKSTVCPAATVLESARRESRSRDVLAFVTVSAAALSSAFELLHAAGSASMAATINHVVLRPGTSFVIVMLVARHLTKQYRSGEHELTVLR